jgi:hypothetical protein
MTDMVRPCITHKKDILLGRDDDRSTVRHFSNNASESLNVFSLQHIPFPLVTPRDLSFFE